MIRFSCPKCDTSLKSSDDTAGTTTACPRCGERFEVPEANGDGNGAPRKGKGGEPKSSRPTKTAAASKAAVKGGPAAKKGGKATARGRDSAGSKTSPLVYVGIGAAVLVLAGVGVAVVIMSSKPKDTTLAQATTEQIASPSGTQTAPSTQSTGTSTTKPTAPPGTGPNGKDSAKTRPGEVPPGNTPPTVRPGDTTPPGKVAPPPPPPEGSIGHKVYNRLLKSTCFMTNVLNSGGLIMGSGSLIDRKNKLILTNYHVVMDRSRGRMYAMFPQYPNGSLLREKDSYLEMLRRDEGNIPVTTVWEDKSHDLALVQLSGDVPSGVVPLPIAKQSVVAGDLVHSLGNPGVSDALWVYTSGTVRQVYHIQTLVAASEVFALDSMVVETQSPTNPGDSGGPMANRKGQLVAVTESGNRLANAVSLFVDVSEVRRMLKQFSQRQNIKLELPDPDQESIADGPADARILATYIDQVHSPDPAARRQGLAGIGGLGRDAKSAAKTVVGALKDKDEQVRKAAADALRQIGRPGVSELQAVLANLNDTNPEIRSALAEALGQMGSDADEAVKPLAGLLKDSDEGVRAKAAEALGKIGAAAKDAVPRLAETLEKDKSADVRAAAAEALGLIGSDAKPAAGSLGKAVGDPNKMVKLRALGSIEKLGPDAKAAVPGLTKGIKERDSEIKKRSMEAIGAVGRDAGKEVAMEVAFLLEDRDLMVEASVCLAKIGKPAVKPLITALHSTKPWARLGAVHALGEIAQDAREAVPFLRRLMLTDNTTQNRNEAQKALEKIVGK